MAIPPILSAKAPPASSYRQQSAAGRYRPQGTFSPAGIPPSAPSHVYVQAPSAPPIVRSQAPPASSYRQQSAAGAYQPHGSFSPAGVPAAPQPAPGVRLAQVLAATKTANPWTGSKSAVTGQILSTWFALRAKGLLPGSAVPPKIIFDRHETPGVGAYVMKVPGASGSEFHVPPSLAKMLASPKGPNAPFYSNWARDAIVHELAHTAQNAGSGQSTSLVEGGAQTFAQNAAPQVFKNTYVAPSRGAYGQYVNQVSTREPNQWVMHGQFQPGAQPPAVNLPGSQGFRTAMRSVGAAAGRAAEMRAIENNYLAQPNQLPIGRGGELLGESAAMPGYAAMGVGYKVRRNR